MPITRSTLLLLVPLLLIDLGLLVWALVDLARPERRVKGNSKLVWALVIIFVSTLGPLVYLLAGREEA
ncbi:MAG TPA: PLD nuclease N-terminal domain-containing protein [Thermomicrobiaceae bacterium]|nr:PLD nuclease N-terminal domain-containing protein [Thermomicrobiaceae bacterium]